jgi:hypothetical protein
MTMGQIRLMALCAVYLLFFAFGCRAAEIADSGKYALIIGNGAYESNVLTNPVNDATDMATAFQKAGAKVTIGKNLDLKGMRLTVQQFIDNLPKNATVFFFFSGHGAQYAGQNYLIPVGAISKIRVPADLDANALSVSDLLEELNRSGAAVTVAFLDACRDSPFTNVADIKPGLARNSPRSLSTAAPKEFAKGPGGVLISYSTAPNAVALDGNGRNSPYTRALKAAIVKANATLEDALKSARSAVTKETKGEQTPWYESSINGDVFPAGQNRLPLEDLLRALIPAKASNGDPLATIMSWAPDGLSSVDWRTDSVEHNEKGDFVVDDYWRGWMRRRGSVIIIVDGRPTHFLLKKDKVPAPWTLTMVGARSGPQAVKIDSEYFSVEFNGFSEVKFLHEDKRCRTGDSLNGTKLYEVVLPQKQMAYLGEDFTCGAAACTYGYVLFLDPADKKHAGCH